MLPSFNWRRNTRIIMIRAIINPIVVIGFGNRLLADEAVGIVLLEALARQANEFPNVDFLELGTGGLAVLHALAGRQKAIILDCARMSAAPGTMRRFTPEMVRAGAVSMRLSLHEGGLLEQIDLARRVEACPENLVIFGIQPATIAPGEKLSPVLQARLPEYLDVIGGELCGLGRSGIRNHAGQAPGGPADCRRIVRSE
jgi:hydrogenase maturation protease